MANDSAVDETKLSSGSNGSGSDGDYAEQFKAFSTFGDAKSDGKQITLSQSDKWMKQAKVFGKVITTTDTGIHFKKLKMAKLNVTDYEKFLEDLAKTKKIKLTEIKDKLAGCGAPGVPQSAKVVSDFRNVECFVVFFFLVWRRLSYWLLPQYMCRVEKLRQILTV